MQNAKDAARQIIDHLPEQATWDDIMCELYVKQKIEAGLKAAIQYAQAHEDTLEGVLEKMQRIDSWVGLRRLSPTLLTIYY